MFARKHITFRNVDVDIDVDGLPDSTMGRPHITFVFLQSLLAFHRQCIKRDDTGVGNDERNVFVASFSNARKNERTTTSSCPCGRLDLSADSSMLAPN
jgi:hypothetical protein